MHAHGRDKRNSFEEHCSTREKRCMCVQTDAYDLSSGQEGADCTQERETKKVSSKKT